MFGKLNAFGGKVSNIFNVIAPFATIAALLFGIAQYFFDPIAVRNFAANLGFELSVFVSILLGSFCWVWGHSSGVKQTIANRVYGSFALKDLWGREAVAKAVWVISPNLYWDVHSANATNSVKGNRDRDVEYSYICPKTEETEVNLSLYKALFNLTDEEIEKQFLFVDKSELTDFLTEIVIFDPSNRTKTAFGYPHKSPQANPDVVEFPNDVVEHYVSTFSEVWHRNKPQAKKAGNLS